ncbi:hypothetical protein NL676_008947 [Syzygium grande]|nr:hypothetical protein NL676_008947 [Syzygium grande]
MANKRRADGHRRRHRRTPTFQKTLRREREIVIVERRRGNPNGNSIAIYLGTNRNGERASRREAKQSKPEETHQATNRRSPSNRSYEDRRRRRSRRTEAMIDRSIERILKETSLGFVSWMGSEVCAWPPSSSLNI